MNNRKIIDYLTLEDSLPSGLDGIVMDHLKDGWELLNPMVMVMTDTDGTTLQFYCQTMAKYQPPTEMEIDDALRSKSNKNNHKLFEVIEHWVGNCVMESIAMVNVDAKGTILSNSSEMLEYIKENKIIK